MTAHHTEGGTPITTSKTSFNRRTFLTTSGLAGLGALSAAPADAARNPVDGFAYEITRSEPEWRARLNEAEFKILREGDTELPKSHPYWSETQDGHYTCKGCDLHLYDSAWKVVIDKGWAFYKHSVENSVLLGIDGPGPEVELEPHEPGAMIEAHCRRCGSHLGHIVWVNEQLLHCINGTSLVFHPETG